MGSVSILIPALNEEQTLTRLLPSLVEAVGLQQDITEVVLVSSPSVDGTRELCSSASQRWKFIKHVELKQWMPKFNVLAHGLIEARNEWLIVIDADVQVSSDKLAALASYANGEPRLVQARTIPDSQRQIQANGAESFPLLLLWATFITLAWHWIRINRPDLRWAVSAHCYLCHRGGFPSVCPPRFPDDIFIGLHYWELGLPILYVPDIWVIFKPAQTFVDFVRQKLRNRIALFHLRETAPEKIATLRKAFRYCLSNRSCLEQLNPKAHSFALHVLLVLDEVLWQAAKVLAIAGCGLSGRWRAVESTKQSPTL